MSRSPVTYPPATLQFFWGTWWSVGPLPRMDFLFPVRAIFPILFRFEELGELRPVRSF